MTLANTALRNEDDGFPLGRAALDRLRLEILQMREQMQAQPEGAARSASKSPTEPEARPETPAERLAAELDVVRADVALLKVSDRSDALADAVSSLGRRMDLINAKVIDPVSVARLEREAQQLMANLADTAAKGALDNREPTQRIEAELQVLHDRLHQLSTQIGALAPATGAGPLAEQMGLLVRRLDEGAMVETANLAPLVEVIERHLVGLTERMMESQQHLARLTHIEDALNRLGDEMVHLRHASAQISSEAVQAVALKLSARDDAPALIGLKRSLAALEARQREFEQRTEDLMVRELELGLKDLADLERARAPRAAGATVHSPPQPAPGFNLDRRLFEMALDGTVHDSRTETPVTSSFDWAAADGRPRKRARSWLFGRAAMVLGCLTAGGLLASQMVGAGPLRPGADKAGLAMTEARDLPVSAPDAASLPAAVGPASLRAAAAAGDAQAAYEVGSRYADGRGTEVDEAAAAKWLAHAAAKGSVPAAYRLGLIQEYGLRNAVEARRLYAWAAERGNVPAMHALGVLATQGTDGRPDWTQAAWWFRKAAELGHRDSQHNLGVIYARGFSGETNLSEAYKWFTLAAAQGDTDSARKRDEAGAQLDPSVADRVTAAAAAFMATVPDPQANRVAPRPEWEAGISAVPRLGSATPG